MVLEVYHINQCILLYIKYREPERFRGLTSHSNLKQKVPCCLSSTPRCAELSDLDLQQFNAIIHRKFKQIIKMRHMSHIEE